MWQILPTSENGRVGKWPSCPPQASSMSVGLQGDSSLQVEISDAISERSRTSCLPHFAQTEFSVMRQHEEFIWLHDVYEEGVCRPPCEGEPAWENRGYTVDPPSPSMARLFEASKEKLQKLDEEDRSITRQEFAKMKQELEEYLAIFKKTVTIHEVSLQQLAAHPTLCRDHNFFVFLEYSQDLIVRGKNRKEHLGFLRNIMKSADEALHHWDEVDDFFEHERTFLLKYHACIQDACLRADQVGQGALMGGSISASLADDYMPISAALTSLGSQEVKPVKDVRIPSGPSPLFLCLSFFKLAELFERLRELEGQVASSKDLKLLDMLRYYMRDSQAAKARGLLFWQLLALADYKNANKALDRASTIIQVWATESHQPCASLTQPGRVSPLMDFKSHGSSFHENLTELGELELKHAKASTLLLRSTLVILKGEP
ncbi:hypothetical protein FD755_011184 [Muntiacus reevesi]|uniref:Uncharacterized protein n=1 Tax=Muntiacus reevesi TaxID=9886 RepID=A0A5N3XS18_MUNRE|nr:hypothetical protein FD755_011184 [Muntiacus reevesi]